MTSRIHLSALGIETESERYAYRDDGFVEDVVGHMQKVHKEFKQDACPIILFEGPYAGMTWPIIDTSPKLLVTCYVHEKDPARELFTRGHEETHVLHRIGQMELLLERLRKKGFDVDLSRYMEPSGNPTLDAEAKEVLADIGGFYGALAHCGLRQILESNGNCVLPAFQILSRARRDGR
ncbi:MAG: hypothetical protein KKD18_04915 [Nanoarchaeota archaeon]|nr:hypothetical protein [Nanoarchaeota archaeon]MBU0977732.1 hypothetical protein [Nanoarchaeota archaeon]